MLRILSPQLYFTVLTAACAAAFLYIQVNLLAASMFAEESRAPLVFTLLITTAASAIVAILLSSSQDELASEEVRRSQTVAAFVFINASASAVGLLSNLLESLEFLEPAGPNGLTWILEVYLRDQQPPLFPYVLVLALILVPVAGMLFEGAELLMSKDEWTEQKMGLISSLSFFLFVVWIAIGSKWKRVPFGAEAIANFWTITFYSIVTLLSLWVYGRVLLHGLKAAPNFISALGRGGIQILSNWRLWAILAIGVSVAVFGYTAASFVATWLNQFVLYILRLLGLLSATASNEFNELLPSVNRLARREVLFVWPILFAFFLALFITFGTASFIVRVIPKVQIGGKLSWRDVQKWVVAALLFISALVVAPVLGLLWLFALVIRQRLTWQISTGVLMVLVLTVDSAEQIPVSVPNIERIVVTQPNSELIPVSSPIRVSPNPIKARVSNIDFCSDWIGTFGWAFGSKNRIEQNIDACYEAPAPAIGESIVLLVAVSSNGPSQAREENRSYERAKELAVWAQRSFDDLSRVLVLDLGMAKSTDLGAKLRPLVGPTSAKRPIGGFIATSTDDRATRSQLMRLTRRLIEQADLKDEFSKCDLYRVNESVDGVLDLAETEMCVGSGTGRR